MTGKWPENDIDHINVARGDNRFSNLREATRSENLRNRGAQKNNTSGFKGVSWQKSSRKWDARINIHGKVVHLGYFDDPEDAYQAYCQAAKELHGEFYNIGGSK